ncbi:E7 [Eptesicus regulus papillomavirus]|nr:E7 [Eptesicus regulus papillomavirus]
MRGRDVDSKDIVLDLEPIPANLLSDEVLQPEEEEEQQLQVQLSLYEVGSNCADCDRKILFTCCATEDAIRLLQLSLVDSSLSYLCVPCAKQKKAKLNNGRQ